MELEKRSKKRRQECEEEEIKGVQKWSRRFRDMSILVFTVFPCWLSAKEIVKGLEKVERIPYEAKAQPKFK